MNFEEFIRDCRERSVSVPAGTVLTPELLEDARRRLMGIDYGNAEMRVVSMDEGETRDTFRVDAFRYAINGISPTNIFVDEYKREYDCEFIDNNEDIEGGTMSKAMRDYTLTDVVRMDNPPVVRWYCDDEDIQNAHTTYRDEGPDAYNAFMLAFFKTACKDAIPILASMNVAEAPFQVFADLLRTDHHTFHAGKAKLNQACYEISQLPNHGFVKEQVNKKTTHEGLEGIVVSDPIEQRMQQVSSNLANWNSKIDECSRYIEGSNGEIRMNLLNITDYQNKIHADTLLLRDLEYRMKERTTAATTMVDVIADIEANTTLRYCLYVRGERKICLVDIRDCVLEGHSLGNFIYCLRLNDSNKVRDITVNAGRGCYKLDGYFHPHISSSGSPCLGAGSEQYEASKQSMDIKGCLQVLLGIMHQYNPDSPYRALEDFKRVANRVGKTATDYNSSIFRKVLDRVVHEPKVTSEMMNEMKGKLVTIKSVLSYSQVRESELSSHILAKTVFKVLAVNDSNGDTPYLFVRDVSKPLDEDGIEYHDFKIGYFDVELVDEAIVPEVTPVEVDLFA